MGANKRTERPGVEKRDVSVADIVVSCLPTIELVARRLTRNPTEAADLVQETCRRAIEKSSYFRHRSNPAGWLCRILQRICYDRQRRRRHELPIADLALPASEPEPISSWRWISDEDYAEAFARLSPAHQLTYRRHVTDGDSYKDIASDLKISRDTVGVRIMRARAHMRSFLEERLNVRKRRAECMSVLGRPRVRKRMNNVERRASARGTVEETPQPPPDVCFDEDDLYQTNARLNVLFSRNAVVPPKLTKPSNASNVIIDLDDYDR